MNQAAWSDLMFQRMQQAQLEQLKRFQMQQQMMPLMAIQQPEGQEDEEDESSEQQRTLFIANLDETKVDEELLYELFMQAGPIEKISFPKKKSFAFITYMHSCSPVYAMHLFQGVKLFGTPVVIKFNGTTNLPPLLRRLLPPDYGFATNDSIAPQRSHNPFSEPSSSQRRSFDNSALRNSNFSAFIDLDNYPSDNHRNNRRERSPHSHSRDRGNDSHRQSDRSPTRWRQNNNSDKNWTHGPDRKRSRSHHGNQPYDRRRY